MRYAIVNFNDNLCLKIEGFGLAPVTWLFEELSALYNKRLALRSNHIVSTLHDLESDELISSSETEDAFAEVRACEAEIYKFMSENNIPKKLAVVQIGEEETQVVVKELTTGTTLYVPKHIFSKHEVSEIEAKNHVALETTENLKTLKTNLVRDSKNRR